MIYDYLDREIGLEGILNDDFKNPGAVSKKSWSDFHQNYVSQVGRIVGFKKPQLRTEKLTKPERKVFERLYKEYHGQKILPELFGSYENFFHCFFAAPYGLEYSPAQGKYADALPCLEARLQEEKSKESGEGDEEIINQLREEASIIHFVRKINLPALLYESLNAYGKSAPKSKFGEIRISCSTGSDPGKLVSTILKPEFSSNQWEDVLVSGNDDCLFINLSRDEQGKYSVKFQKYWFASFLHTLHPKINYLNFQTPSDALPSPLLKVKLMEAEGEKEGKYLIVGGVLGENLKAIKTKGVEEFVDQSVREFFLRNYSKKDRLFYNFSHVPGEEKPYNQFVGFIKRKYSVSEEKLKSIGTVGGKRCTHRLKIGWDQDTISRISNIDEEGEDKFRGEQYSETFEPNREKGALGAFTTLDGLVQGFDISYKKREKHSFLRSDWRPSKGAIVYGALVAASLLFGLWYKDREASSRSSIQSEPEQTVNVLSEVAADEEYPVGSRIAKPLDFDGDGRSDLVNWSGGRWYLDFSYDIANERQTTEWRTRENKDNFGKWDIILNHPALQGRFVWPSVQDIDADGKEDFILYEKDTGSWFIKFTRWSLFEQGFWKDWDWIIKTGAGAACKEKLFLDYRKSIYNRPLPGDYNGDGFVDLAVVCSDGIWRIDYGGSRLEDYGQIDDEIKFLDNHQLSQAPGWAYLPFFDEVPGGRRIMGYRIPDGITVPERKTNPNSGLLFIIRQQESNWPNPFPFRLGGNEQILLSGRHASRKSTAISLKSDDGNWRLYTPKEELNPEPKGVFGGHECFPILGDFDGDGLDDRAVSCPNEWRIVYSNPEMPRDPDGVRRVPLTYLRNSIPGVPVFGGISYNYAQRLIKFVARVKPKEAPPLTLDMVRMDIPSKYHFPKKRK